MNAPAPRRAHALGLAMAAAVAAAPAHGAPRGSILLGGDAPGPRANVERDAWLPTGERRRTPARPGSVEPPACSFRRPVCVHRGQGVPAATALAAVAALEAAYERLVLALGLPAPEPDRGRGGDDGLDLYLVDEPLGARDFEIALDPLDPWGFDRASAFCRVHPGGAEPLARLATRCVGEAIAARLDPAAAPSLREAYATHLWLTTGPLTAPDLAALDDAQAAPERAVAGSGRPRGAGAAALLFEGLDVGRGRGEPGALATALLAAAASDTAPGALEWDDEPDLFDVLRHTLGPQPAAVGRWFGQLAVDRGFLGSRDDGTHLPRLVATGDAGRIRFDWTLPLSTLPRRVAVTRPIEPTGSVYLWVTLDQVLATNRLGVQAKWEPPAAFQWTLVKVGPQGRELARVAAPFQEHATTVTQEVDDLAAAAALVIVGTNLGGVDLEHPYDPDLWPPEPSGCTVYVTPF